MELASQPSNPGPTLQMSATNVPSAREQFVLVFYDLPLVAATVFTIRCYVPLLFPLFAAICCYCFRYSRLCCRYSRMRLPQFIAILAKIASHDWPLN